MRAYRGECSCGHEPETALALNPAKTQGPPTVWVRCQECSTPVPAAADGSTAVQVVDHA